ncbi:MAG TPA: class I SAM-dependent methyltransferase [Tepidisphaeraceae bacterium]|nr:class I SAM-dependent methyltransferase [Tepidisphaeraceae bacterium]
MTTRLLPNHGEIFSQVYRNNTWLIGSGTGSQEASTAPYRRLLQRLLRRLKPRLVVDLGCGDWTFSRLLDWRNTHYRGIDVVPSIVARNRRLFGSSRIRFSRMDLQQRLPPPADLYLLKDVLQHWTDDEVLGFLRRMAGRRMLITNTVPWGVNRPLEIAGEYRPLDIRLWPFEVRAKALLRYSAAPTDLKLVLLVDPTPRVA